MYKGHLFFGCKEQKESILIGVYFYVLVLTRVFLQGFEIEESFLALFRRILTLSTKSQDNNNNNSNN